MRTMLVILAMVGSTVVAHAQPGATEPYDGGDYYAPAPQYAAPPPQYVQLQLTYEQQELLERGEISIGRYVTGGILSYALGFGVGHAVQGRWSDKGWLFTVGESASIVSLVYGLAKLSSHRCGFEGNEGCHAGNSRGEGYLIAGFVGMVGFRVWEVVDAWVAPPIHNRKVRALKRQLGLAPPTYGLYVSPPQSSGSGGVAGLSLSF